MRGAAALPSRSSETLASYFITSSICSWIDQSYLHASGVVTGSRALNRRWKSWQCCVRSISFHLRLISFYGSLWTSPRAVLVGGAASCSDPATRQYWWVFHSRVPNLADLEDCHYLWFRCSWLAPCRILQGLWRLLKAWWLVWPHVDTWKSYHLEQIPW